MKSVQLILLAILIGMCTQLQAQTVNKKVEKKLIKQTIGMYFDGWMTRDTSKLGQAMHATCQLKNVKDDAVIIYPRAKYLSFFKPGGPKRVDSGGKILKIDITGNIGSAKCQIDTPKFQYTDYFNLMKVGGQWYIVDKIATSKKK